MTARALVPLLAIVAALSITLWPGTARAEATVIESGVENGYPDSLVFTLSAESDIEITDVALRYVLGGRGISGLGKPEALEPGTRVDVEVSIEVNSSSGYIPVSTEFRYYWEITTSDGELTTTPEETFLYLPPDRDWQTVESPIMRVYYHGQRESLANDYLAAGEATFEQLAVGLLQTELPVTPVKVVLFATPEEMAPARQGRGGTFDAAVTTCGVKLTVDTVFVIPISCGTSDVTDTLRHEFAHIINQAAGEGSLGRLPSWIDEGTAVHAQTEPGDNFRGAFEAAARGDRLIPFNQMGTPSNDPSTVNLFYGQSWAMTGYLIERGGPEEYARFFASMKAGQRFDRALEEVYGFDLATFETEFRQQLGLEPRVPVEPTAPAADSAEEPQEAEPTRAPLATTGSSGDSGIDRAPIIIVGVATLFALLAVFSYLLASMAASRRQMSATAAGGGVAYPPPAQESELNTRDWTTGDEDDLDDDGVDDEVMGLDNADGPREY